MRQKTHCFKIIILCSLFVFVAYPAKAENWIKVVDNKQTIWLDSDSVKVNNNSVYYNVKYYENKAEEEIVVTIQSKNDLAGIVSSCKFSKYQKDKSLANTNTTKTAKSFKYIDSNSLLYNANIIANSLNKTNNINSSVTSNNDPDFGPYMRELQRRIKMNWEPPKGNESKTVILLFKIAKDGRLISQSVIKSSGMPAADRAAMRAVNLTAPFKPLPQEYKGDSVDIQFTFDYNVFGINQ